MSFSKAKIHRFNECENDVPPPGAYNPKFDSKVRGLVIEKSERFHDNKSEGSANCNLSVCSRSTGNVAVFQTPQLPIKKNVDRASKSATKVKQRTLHFSNNQKFKYDSEHQLADLQVECSNKDRTIQEQEKHIDDMKEEVRKLQTLLKKLHEKQEKIEEQHRKDIETMGKLQQEVLNGHNEKYQTEAAHLRSQLLQISEEKEHEIKARKIMEGDLRNRITKFSKKVTMLEVELTDKIHMYKEKIQSFETQIENLVTKLNEVTISHEQEVNLLEQEKSKLDLCVNNLTEDRDKLELKLQKRQNVILELQAQLSALQCELDELRYKHQEEIDKLKIDFEKEKMILQHENEAKVKDINEENSLLKEELKNAHQELENWDKQHNLVLDKHREDLTNIMKLRDEETFKLKQQLENARLDYLKEIENLAMARDQEIAELEEATTKKVEEETKRIKQHANKMVENAEAVCRAECEERVKKVIAERDAKVNAMIRDATITVEEEMRLTAERYKACLERVEMERVALDDKLAQKDTEITKLSALLEELKSSAETQESFGQSLQMELDRAETELAEKKEELRALKDQIRAEAAEMVARKKRFDIVMSENQASVAALSKRLAQSNAEVERLQHELKRGEDCIHEHRDLLGIMRNNSQMVHEQVHALMQQLDAKKGLVDQLQAESLSEVESLKSLFEAKIDDLKKITSREVAKLQADNDTKTAQNVELQNQLHEMAAHLTNAQSMLLKLEERNDAQELEITRIKLLNDKVNEQLKERKAALEDTNKLLENRETVLKEANSTIEELSKKIKSLEEKNSLVQESNELLEEERARREAAEVEIKTLTEHNKRLIKDYQEINEKYVEVIGHNNHRQRIKHVSQLKDKISQLEQELQGGLRTIEQQQKIIEKLKAEERRAHSKGKENMLGVPKSTHTTPVSSRHKSLLPLKNRND